MTKKMVIITESGKLFCKNEIAGNSNIILINPAKNSLNKFSDCSTDTILIDFEIYLKRPQMISTLKTYFPNFVELTVENADKIAKRVTGGEYELKIPETENKRISELLENLGFKFTLDGCEYIKHALYMGCCSKTPFMNLKKNVYGKLGMRFGKNAGSIERGIRFAIKDAFNSGRLSQSFDKIPSNGEFFSTLLKNL